MRCWQLVLVVMLLGSACTGKPGAHTGSDCDPLVDEQDIELEYLAELADGRWLMVTRASARLENIRVFFGQRDAVLERGLWAFGRQRDGGTTDVNFFVDGERANAFFPIRCGEPPKNRRGIWYQPDCPGSLTLAGETIPFERREKQGPDGLKFVCGSNQVTVDASEARKVANKLVGGFAPSCRFDRDARKTGTWQEFNCSGARVRVDLRTGEATRVDEAVE